MKCIYYKLIYLLQFCLCHQPGHLCHTDWWVDLPWLHHQSYSVQRGRLGERSPSTTTREIWPWLQLLRQQRGQPGEILILITVLSLYFRHCWSRGAGLAILIMTTSPPLSCWWGLRQPGSTVEICHLLAINSMGQPSTTES